MGLHEVISPLFIAKNKTGDKWYLNLNNYRNTHYQTLNNMKKKYKELIAPQIEALPVMKKVEILFAIYAKDKRKFDIGNVGSVHEKFFCDALVELGKLPDDNYTHIATTSTQFMGIDKDNPRVEIIIKEV